MQPTGPTLRPTVITRAARAGYRSRRRVATGLAIALAVVFGYHAVFGQNGITAYAEKRSEDRALAGQIKTLQGENDRLKTHVDHLQNDPDAIEHEAREQLHYARPGEVIYTLNDTPAPLVSPQGSPQVSPQVFRSGAQQAGPAPSASPARH